MSNDFFASQNLMRRSNVASCYLDAKLTDFPKKFQDSGKSAKSLFVTGPSGTGKTHFLCACIRHVIEEKMNKGKEEAFIPPNRNPIEFLSVPEFMLQIKQSYEKNAKLSEADILNRYSSVELLALDDLGVERVSDWSIQMLYLLIDRRSREMKQTLISSNLSLSEIADKLDDRIASRIAGMCEALKFQGEDKRLAKKAANNNQVSLH